MPESPRDRAGARSITVLIFGVSDRDDHLVPYWDG